MKPLLLISALLLPAITASGQDASSSFTAHGGEIEVLTKSTKRLSGSLGVSMSEFASGVSGYEATLGGTLLEDRLWFFASGQHRAVPVTGFASDIDFPDRVVHEGLDAKLSAQLGSRQMISAVYDSSRQSAPDAFSWNAFAPSTFLSLRYDGIISDRMFFSMSVVRSEQ